MYQQRDFTVDVGKIGKTGKIGLRFFPMKKKRGETRENKYTLIKEGMDTSMYFGNLGAGSFGDNL